MIRPIQPVAYDGSDDAAKFLQFVRQGTNWLRMGNLPEDQHIFMLSYRLTGKALDFYNRKVVQKESEWTLSDFFAGMLKYCFPADYRMKLRDKLGQCYQNKRSVSDYSSEFEELYFMIGLADDQEKVVRLWRGFAHEIQAELYRQELNPESSTWDEVVSGAEKAEVLLGKKDKPRDAGAAAPGTQAGKKARGKGKFSKRSKSPDASIQTSAAAVSGEKSKGSKNKKDPGREATERPWERKLTAQKREELMAANKCLNCEAEGHFARNCPKLQTVPSKQKGKPPGLATHGVTFETASALFESTEHVLETFAIDLEGDREGGSTSQLLDENEIGNVLEYLDGDLRYNSPSGETHTPLGDIRARFIRMALTDAAPYPGDEHLIQTDPGPRFVVTKQRSGDFLVLERADAYAAYDLEAQWINNESFQIGLWYARLRQVVACRPLNELENNEAWDTEVGDAVATMAAVLLWSYDQEAGNDAHLELFDIGRSSRDPYCYTVTLHHLGRSCELPIASLNNETFDLRQWYKQSFRPQAEDHGVREGPGRREASRDDIDLAQRMGRLTIKDETDSQEEMTTD
ncbi:unnamed protein product [Mycena citricolor]|uniref:CCHC-type domain-containing protein n=1 Tax=Mycena citricolor TaxID=2018698 RepID=A0AAD2HG71_9AGAR|nr:unnamed protein product [Mycena citricolor]